MHKTHAIYFPHLCKGFGPIPLKTFLLEIIWNVQTPLKFNVWQHSPHGEGHLAISQKQYFDGNDMKCIEL